MIDAPKPWPVPSPDQMATTLTSNLLQLMDASTALAAILEFGGTESDVEPFRLAVAAELDRRIPPRDPRVGKLCRLSARVSFPHPGRVGRIVSVEPGGALHFREETCTQEYVDIRVPAAEIVEWLEEPLSSGTHGDATEK